VRTRVLLLLSVFLLGCLGLSVFSASTATQKQFPSIVYTSTPRFLPSAWLTGGERFPNGAAVMLRGDGESRKLIPSFAASADPDVSFDGSRILFAGKKTATDAWQIWEIGADGTALRQITFGTSDAVRPFYLPEDRVVYSRRVDGRFVLESTSTSGSAASGLFFVPGNAIATDVLRDGRILFGSSYPFGGTTPEIYTVYSDGSGVESYRCDHKTGRFGGRQVASGDIVFSTGRGLARFTSPLAQQVSMVAPAGDYAGDVTESNDGSWLLSKRSGISVPFQLVMWKPGQSNAAAVISDKSNLVQARIVAGRSVPNRHPSALHPWKTANLLALNVYTSKYNFPAGSVASVRVYTQAPDGKESLMGTAPVENDGSLYVKVPGDQPLKFELVDRQGKSLKKQAGWMWARAGEQRVCVGCHAGPEHAPENAVPKILLRSTTPADMTANGTSTNAGGN